MAKVYVFTYRQACEGEFLGIENRVFKKRTDALKAFEEWKADEMKYVEQYDWVVGANTDEHFEAWEHGDYCNNHTEGFVNEYEIE